ncbi:hypothetical protein SAMN02745174_00493 [Cetobacterium ceti]|uniref:Uncharacterized protein n=1 Tax=Cetobacterium ceti TaxID=180163 RepID=A0A1T4KLZ4_9FUSO|nr:hypothetical protein SAMN02745174_00493 [Cetobacterium ceti]
MMFAEIEENIYDETFDSIYHALLEEYKEGTLTVKELETNIEEQQQVLLNSMFEGETKFAYTSAIVDAHQYALAIIQKSMNN